MADDPYQLVQAVTDRPNITAAILYHTFSGVHLRPYSAHDDEHFPTFDLRAYKLIGDHATKIFHALISPKLEIHSLDVTEIKPELHSIRLVVVNTGWLPSSVSQKARERKASRPVEVELTLPAGARLVTGDRKLEVGELDGRIDKRSTLWWGHDEGTTDRAKAEWVVEAPQGAVIELDVRHARAGRIRRTIELT